MIWNRAGHVKVANSDVHSNRFESGTLVEENPDGASFEACRFFGNGHAGIVSQRMGDLQMTKCEVFSNIEGILVQDSGSASIERCIVHENGNGIFIGYDHIGAATLAHNRVFSNHTKGILLGTGRKKVKLIDNEEKDNGLWPGMGGLTPNLRKEESRVKARKLQFQMDMRKWARNMQKSKGSAKKAAKASSEKTPFDFAAYSSFPDSQAFAKKVSAASASCAYCKIAPEQNKFQKCSVCGLVCYCSSACQKAHWKAGHKQECVAIPKHPSFIDPSKSVDGFVPQATK